ncbi:hypothetical protein [Agrococcus sp. ARC_14]|uniref:hypothetical protein n=1 Tax=Agrococcus sp. ARC_14 TaxID=2919927 RepID=UPI001F06C8F2|nr:hypothetical protein [Agrococcus sp. ARC_14]MCH1881976.1 hypothetical protein [Agrococcus sp. ARC_14]
MDPTPGRSMLATGMPVAVVVLLHAIVSTVVIAIVEPDVPDLVPYWLMSVTGPSLTWAVLVLGRAAVWRQPSTFWLGASAGIVVVLSFCVALFLYVSPVSVRGVPLALVYSSWVLLACATVVALVLRALGRHDAPVDAELEPRAASLQTADPA